MVADLDASPERDVTDARNQWIETLLWYAVHGAAWTIVGPEIVQALSDLAGINVQGLTQAQIIAAGQQYVQNVAYYRTLHAGAQGDDLHKYLRLVVGAELQSALAGLASAAAASAIRVRRETHPDATKAGPCKRCLDLEGTHLPDAEGLYYWHPNCACSWTPIFSVAGVEFAESARYFTDARGTVHPIGPRAENTAAWKAAMPAEQTAALQRWTESHVWTKRMREAITNKTPDSDPNTGEHAIYGRDLEEALATGPVHNGVVYRGMHDVSDDAFDTIINGKEFVSTSPLSFSKSRERASNLTNTDNAMMITADSGHHGVDVSTISNFREEQEVIIPRGDRFKVASANAWKTNSGKRYAEVHLVPMNDEPAKFAGSPQGFFTDSKGKIHPIFNGKDASGASKTTGLKPGDILANPGSVVNIIVTGVDDNGDHHLISDATGKTETVGSEDMLKLMHNLGHTKQTENNPEHPLTHLKAGDALTVHDSQITGTVLKVDQDSGKHTVKWSNIDKPDVIKATTLKQSFDEGGIEKISTSPVPPLAVGDEIHIPGDSTSNGIIQSLDGDGKGKIKWLHDGEVDTIGPKTFTNMFTKQGFKKVEPKVLSPTDLNTLADTIDAAIKQQTPSKNSPAGLKVGDTLTYHYNSVGSMMNNAQGTIIKINQNTGAHVIDWKLSNGKTESDYGYPLDNIKQLLNKGTITKNETSVVAHPETGLKAGDAVVLTQSQIKGMVIGINADTGTHVIQWEGESAPSNVSLDNAKGLMDKGFLKKASDLLPTTGAKYKIGDIFNNPTSGQKFVVSAIDPASGQYTMKYNATDKATGQPYVQSLPISEGLINSYVQVGAWNTNAVLYKHPKTGLSVGEHITLHTPGVMDKAQGVITKIDPQNGLHTIDWTFTNGTHDTNYFYSAGDISAHLQGATMTKNAPDNNVASATSLKVGDVVINNNTTNDKLNLNNAQGTVTKVNPSQDATWIHWKKTDGTEADGSYGSHGIAQYLTNGTFTKVEPHPLSGLKVGDVIVNHTPYNEESYLNNIQGTVTKIDSNKEGTHIVNWKHKDGTELATDYTAKSVNYNLDQGTFTKAEVNPITGLKVGDTVNYQTIGISFLKGATGVVKGIQPDGKHAIEWTYASGQTLPAENYDPNVLKAMLNSGEIVKPGSSPTPNSSGLAVGDSLMMYNPGMPYHGQTGVVKQIASDGLHTIHWTPPASAGADPFDYSYALASVQKNLNSGLFQKIDLTPNAISGLKVGDTLYDSGNSQVWTLKSINAANGYHNFEAVNAKGKMEQSSWNPGGVKSLIESTTLEPVSSEPSAISGLKVGDRLNVPNADRTGLIAKVDTGGNHTILWSNGNTTVESADVLGAWLKDGSLEKLDASTPFVPDTFANGRIENSPNASIPNTLEFVDNNTGIKAGEAWGKQAFDPVLKSLQEPEIVALGDYRDGAYISMNAKLRKRKRASIQVNENIRQIDAVMKRSPLANGIVVYRGADRAAFDYKNPEDLVGTVIGDKGFASTSLSRSKSMSGTYKMVITVPKGAKAFWMEGLDTLPNYYGPSHDEDEILLARGTKFKIDRVQDRDVFMTVGVGRPKRAKAEATKAA